MAITMTAKNDITGDPISTKPATEAYREGWERIFKARLESQAAINELTRISQELGLYDNPPEPSKNE
jgi:hypothetical protein